MPTTILKRSASSTIAGIALLDLAHPGRAPQSAAEMAAAHGVEPAPVEHEHAETRLEVVRLGGVVQAIEVHCGCGEVTVIELDTSITNTPSPAAADPAPSPGAQPSAMPSQDESNSSASVTEEPS